MVNSRKLRELRGERSQRDIAKESGISQATVSDYESGRMKRPSKATLRKFAEFYDVPLEELESHGRTAISEEDALLIQLVELWAEVPPESRPWLVGLVRTLVEQGQEGR